MSADVRDDAATVRAVILACQPVGRERFLDVLARLEAAAARAEELETALREIADERYDDSGHEEGDGRSQVLHWIWDRADDALAGGGAETPR